MPIIDFENYDLSKPMTVPLASTCLSQVFYNPLTFTLECYFRDGSEYSYSGVEPHIFIGLVQSASAGRYFNAVIRDMYDAEPL